MAKIHSYFTFNGNCREAMTFYKNCLGGELTFQTINESPVADEMPLHMKNLILHSTLNNKTFILMGSDMVPETGLKNGNQVSLVINCKNIREANNLFTKLSAKGIILQPLETNFWGALFGALTDRYGNHWLLNYNQENKNKSVYKPLK